MTKHTPATPLPWRADTVALSVTSYGNSSYAAHAANAYPRLVEALRELRDAAVSSKRGHIQPDSLIDRDVSALLRELGESE